MKNGSVCQLDRREKAISDRGDPTVFAQVWNCVREFGLWGAGGSWFWLLCRINVRGDEAQVRSDGKLWTAWGFTLQVVWVWDCTGEWDHSFCVCVCVCLCLFRAVSRHMEVPRLGVKSELSLPAYTTATARGDLSRVCNLHHSSRHHWILNPLSMARDWTCILMDTSWVR